MKEIQLSKRLRTIAKYIEKDARLADIGSDHAYLPCSLVEENKIHWAIAGEIACGPFKRAQKEVQSRGLEDKIKVRLADGAEVIKKEDKIDTISVCGMGGSLIKDILNKGLDHNHIEGTERLLLQPNVREPLLRMFLRDRQYEIIAEEVVEENKKIYEIIVAKSSSQIIDYTDKELLYGPHLMAEKSDLFFKKWHVEKEKLRFIKNQIVQSISDESNKVRKISNKIEEIEELLS